ncbi:MAG: glycoside hydrolase, partial [Pseudomonadota bacterium]|nr:glycoside hydrolase [Pseudomonadota bacterium]
MYATVSTMTESAYASDKGLGVYRSDDAGESWTRITEDPRPAMKIGGGDLPVPRVDPQNADIVYSASIVTCRSNDGGKTWISLRGAPGGDDYQNLWINPRNPKIILLVSDQGALVSVNGGDSWSSWYNQPTAQLYHVAATNTFPYQVCGGQQESGSVCTSTRGNDGEITFRDWHPAGVIEYGYAAPDPLNPNIVYGAGRTEVSRYDAITGQVRNVTPLPVKDSGVRADRTEPILFSPVDPHLLYYAADKLFATSDGGETWKAISPDLTREHTGQPASLPPLTAKQQGKRRGAIYAVAASFKNTQTIWTGTDDGLLWMTHDGGAHWSNITPAGVTPWSKITQIDASRFDDDTAYVSVSRMRLDDQRPYIFRTHDSGKTWQAISSTLPGDSPVNAVRADPERRGLLYAATETAVWVSFDDGDHWQPLQYNLPHTSMRDLLIHGDDLVVATHGRSFWVLDGIGPLRQLAAWKKQSGPFLFTPGTTYRVRRDTNTDTPLPADEPAGENPPDGAIIDYALPADVKGPVELEILDARGSIVRRYSSSDPITPTPAELAQQLIPPYWPRITRPLAANAGMHRQVWDLHYAAPVAIRYEYPISAVPHRTPRVPQGPLALPGTYTVKLIADGRSTTAPLVITMDPRVHTSASDLNEL